MTALPDFRDIIAPVIQRIADEHPDCVRITATANGDGTWTVTVYGPGGVVIGEHMVRS